MRIYGIEYPVIQATWIKHDLTCLWGEVQYQGAVALTDKLLKANKV